MYLLLLFCMHFFHMFNLLIKLHICIVNIFIFIVNYLLLSILITIINMINFEIRYLFMTGHT